MPVRIQILILTLFTIWLLAVSQAKVELTFKKQISMDSIYLDVSGDGNCIAFTNHLANNKPTQGNYTLNDTQTQRRTNNITVYKKNGSTFNLIWNHENDYDFSRKVTFPYYPDKINLNYQRMLSLNYDCSKLYFQQNYSFSELNFLTRQISSIQPNNLVFGGMNDTYALMYGYYGGGDDRTYSSLEVKVYEKQILRTLTKKSMYGRNSWLQIGVFKMEMSKDTKTILFFFFNYGVINIWEVNVKTLNITSSSIILNSNFQLRQNKMCFIDLQEYLFFQTYLSSTDRKYSKLVYQKNQATAEFDTWFEPDSYIFISGNKKVVAILQKVNPGKNVIYLFEVEKLINSGMNRKAVFKNITITHQSQVLQVKLNYQGDRITYIHRFSPFKNELIQLKIDFTGVQEGDNGKNLQINEESEHKASELDSIQVDDTIDDISIDGSQDSLSQASSGKSKVGSIEQEYTLTLKDILTFAITLSFLAACSMGFCIYCCIKSLKRIWKQKFRSDQQIQIQQKSTEISKGSGKGNKYKDEDLDQV